MLTADRIIAMSLIGLSLYFMWHATVLPIGWEGRTGPGGGAFPFWLSAVMLLAAGGILIRSFTNPGRGTTAFFDLEMIRPLMAVTASLVVTIALIPIVGAYVALPLFLVWYLRIYGGHGWGLTAIIALCTPVALFFFFEVTLRILLPKGVTEPWFYPLYATFF
jgi:putative tricarboxylic transport membrane protein